MNDCNFTEHFFLAENLRILRKRMNWSQEELADRIGLNRGNIASYENGTAEPKICNLVKFAHLFNISVFDLTHSKLSNDETYQRAIQLNISNNSMFAPQTLKNYAKEAEDFSNALKGLSCLYRIKANNGNSNHDNPEVLKDQYDQLFSFTQHLMHSHNELISFLVQSCHQHHQED